MPLNRGSFTLQSCTVDVPDRHDLGLREFFDADDAGADTADTQSGAVVRRRAMVRQDAGRSGRRHRERVGSHADLNSRSQRAAFAL